MLDVINTRLRAHGAREGRSRAQRDRAAHRAQRTDSDRHDVALNLGALLGGAIVTETVFSLDGMGYYFIQKLGQLDLYAVMGYLVVTSAIIIVFNLVADIMYGVLDPRVRLH